MAVRTSAIDVVVRMRGSRTFAAQTRKTAAELEAMGVKGSKALSSVALAGQKLQNFGAKMTKFVTLPVLGAGVVAGKFAIDFDKSMRNVNSIAQLPEKQFGKLEDSVLALAGPTAQTPQTLADSMYDLVSSGFDAKQSLTVLKSSAKAATAGLTDAATSTKAVAAVLNAYHLPANKAKDVSDILFRTVDRGVISFEELSSTLGDVLPFASSLGVPLKDVGASVATMTKAGIQAPETMTRIKNVMVSMLKPSEALGKAIKAQGFESGEAMVKQLGFQGALDKLAKTTGGSKEEMAKLFPNIRSLGGALALTGKNAAGAHTDLKGLTDFAGATRRALGEQKKSLAYKWQQLNAQFQEFAIKIAPPLLDALTRIIGVVKSVAKWFDKLPDPVKKTALQAIVLLAAVGPLTWALGGLMKGPFALIAASKGVILFFQGLTATMAALETNAITATSAMIGFDVALLLPIAAAAALAIGLVVLYLKVKWFRDKVNAVFNWLKDHWKLIFAVPIVGVFAAALYGVYKAVKFVADHFGDIKDAAVTAFKWVKGAIEAVIRVVQRLIDKIMGPLKDAFDTVKGPASVIAHAAGVSSIRDARPDLFNPDGSVKSGPRSRIGTPGHVPTGHRVQRAMGGPVIPGGTALVGERGPELVQFPFGANVIPGDQTKRLLASDREAPTVVIPVYLNGRVIAEEVVKAGETAKARK
jgi:TP901 family phage tail tape measure protein